MTDGLVILLPETPDLPWFWWRIAGAEAGRALAFDPARESAPWGDPGAVIVLVPAASAPVIDKPMPAAMPLAQALTAERLSAAKAGLAGERHTALAASDGRILSCSLAASDMTRWLALLSAQGIVPQAMIPAALVLPRVPGALVLGNAGSELLARTDDAAFAGEAALVDALAQGREQVALDETQLAVQLAQVHDDPPLNLLQGAFAPRRASPWRGAGWIVLARMAAVAALLALLLMLVWVVKWNRDSAAQEDMALALAQTRYPSVSDLDGAERMIAAELARRGQGGAGFAAPAAALLDAMRPVPAVRLRDLGYAGDGTLRFTAAAPRAEDLNAMLLALQDQGWKVTVPPTLAPDPTGATVAAITLRAP